MRNSLTKNFGCAGMLLVACILAACGNVSHKIATNGSGAEQLLWPAPKQVTGSHKGGSFPELARLRLITSGINKQQIIALVGAPHFSEGLVAVREWNYLFNFRTTGSDDITQCQYKVLFDQQQLARSFYWLPASCAGRLDPVVAAPVNPVVAAHLEMHSKTQTMELSSDALFPFGKADATSIRASGKERLDAISKSIIDAGDDVSSVHVIGYTDRLGSAAFNKELSSRRAETVMGLLVQRGVSKDKLTAEGRGEEAPLVDCINASRATLVACLAPNRRVLVTVEGSH